MTNKEMYVNLWAEYHGSSYHFDTHFDALLLALKSLFWHLIDFQRGSDQVSWLASQAQQHPQSANQ